VFASPIRLLLLAVAPALAGGCAPVKVVTRIPAGTPHPLLNATKADLLAKYNRQAQAIQSLNASVKLRPTAGSEATGEIEQYHEVNGFILAARPASIRVIGQAPVVGKNIFDMVADAETFRIFIPSKNKFITGPARSEKRAEKPIENLRPQHLLDALFWKPVSDGQAVLFEESDQTAGRAYELTLLRPGTTPAAAQAGQDFEVDSRIYFDRADLSVSQISIFAPGGTLAAEIHYRDWQPWGDAQFPRAISLSRPHDDYRLDMEITKLTLNAPIASDRFHLDQPAGSELVQVGDSAQGAQP